MQMDNHNLKILVIDDDPSSVEILAHRLSELHFIPELTVFEEGQEALSYLNDQLEQNTKIKHEMPDLIILDLYLRGASGLEVLKILKTDNTLRNIPVLVMTVSKKPVDILNTYKSGGTAFLSKFEDENELGRVMKML